MYVRILGGGGQVLEYWGRGVGGGASSKQAHDLVTMSMQHTEVTLKSFRRHVPTRFLINQCQTITFLNLKSDIIENSRIELRGIVLPAPSNQIKVTFIIIFPSTWYICDFFLFHIEIEGKGGWNIGGGQRVCCPPPPPPPPPSQIIGGVGLAPPLPTPMS